jgi:hypothetical protein
MYEYSTKPSLSGMGWSDIAGYPACQDFPAGGVQRCFIDNTEENALAERNGCIILENPTGTRVTTCNTTSGTGGRRWCCPRTNIEWGGPGGHPYSYVCLASRVARSSLTSPGRQAAYDAQERLCTLRIDPGRIDGDASKLMTQTAIKAYQYRVGLPQTGGFDDVTLRSLGFSNATQMSANIASTTQTEFERARGEIAPEPTNWLLVGGVMVGSIVLAGGVYLYMRPAGQRRSSGRRSIRRSDRRR